MHKVRWAVVYRFVANFIHVAFLMYEQNVYVLFISIHSNHNITKISEQKQSSLPWLKRVYVRTIDTGQDVNSINIQLQCTGTNYSTLQYTSATFSVA